MKAIIKHPVKKNRKNLIHRRAFSCSRRQYYKTLTCNAWKTTFDFRKNTDTSVNISPDVFLDWYPHPLHNVVNKMMYYIVDWSYIEPANDEVKEDTESKLVSEPFKKEKDDNGFIPDWAVIISNPSNE